MPFSFIFLGILNLIILFFFNNEKLFDFFYIHKTKRFKFFMCNLKEIILFLITLLLISYFLPNKIKFSNFECGVFIIICLVIFLKLLLHKLNKSHLKLILFSSLFFIFYIAILFFNIKIFIETNYLTYIFLFVGFCLFYSFKERIVYCILFFLTTELSKLIFYILNQIFISVFNLDFLQNLTFGLCFTIFCELIFTIKTKLIKNKFKVDNYEKIL